MTHFPTFVTVLGKGATNPALPSENTEGVLEVKDGILVFRTDEISHAIPLEHIDECLAEEIEEPFGNMWRAGVVVALPFVAALFGVHILTNKMPDALITAAVSFGPALFFWFLYTAVECRITIKAWDEEYGMDAITVFSLGHERSKRETSRELVKEIWGLRGKDRRAKHSKSKPVYRAS